MQAYMSVCAACVCRRFLCLEREILMATAVLPPCLSRRKRLAQKTDEVASDEGGYVEFKNQITVTDGKCAACLYSWGIL